jgi:4-diphosphocytidyl-2-C-methyl-D-erythritol kinase
VDHGVSLAEHAPAKINLALHVTGRRPDGFHLIESLAVFTRHGDRVTVAAAAEDSFSASGRFGAEIPLDGGNLVVRARDVMRQAAARRLIARHSVVGRDLAETNRPVSIHLTKHLPIASGIGGGSSDAAATLTALNRLCRFGLTSEQLAEIGRGLGADVPMCLCAKPLIARGIGEQVEPVAGFPALPMVLVNPGTPVSTPDVFRALASRENLPLPPLPRNPDFKALLGWFTSTRNDLQVPAVSIVPAIAQAIDALTSAGAGFARMSGSGATCFGLFATGDDAARAAAQIQKRQPGWWVVATESISSKDAVHAPA